MTKLTIFITISFISLCNSAYVIAQSYDHEIIKHLTKAFVEKKLSTSNIGKKVITPADIDPRIKIKPCLTPLNFNIPESHSTRNVNVKVSCEDSTPWVLFMPVKIQTKLPVLTAKQTISKGSLLNSTNVEITYIDQLDLRGETLMDMNLIIGAKAKRTLSKGKALSPRSFCVICKGDNVEIIAKSSTFMIKTEGVALKNANLGEKVRVKNNRSGRIVVGTVGAFNKVVIN